MIAAAEPGRAGGLVLVVDDEPEICQIVRRWLERAGYEVEVHSDGEGCLAALERSMPDAVCLDLEMPGMGGLRTLEEIKAHHRLLPVVILTGDTAVETVVSAMQLGAYDYLTKPVSATHLITTVRNAVDRYRMSVRLTQLERELKGQGYPGMTGRSAAMQELYRHIDRIAASDITVLIHGESGTGKELVARAIHEASGRKDKPFVTLNCAAVPESLQESELFGHEKGAFTGATDRRLGSFEQANRGTLFLDEVAELSPSLQAKLLRALQQKTFQRLGGSSEIRSDFRLVAATHRNLAQAVRDGGFREDLYFRIAVLELELPPLRERGEDVLLLAQEFLKEFRGKNDQHRRHLSPEASELLLVHDWPGNVRELRNVIQRAVVMSSGDLILPEHLPERLRRSVLPRPTPNDGASSPEGQANSIATSALGGSPDGALPTLNLEQLEKRAIAQAMAEARGNVSEVVRRLGIGRTTLYRKLKKYELR